MYSTAKSAISTLVIAVTTVWGNLAEDALKSFAEAWKGVETYRVRMSYRQVKGKRSEERTVDFSYKNPGWVRIYVLEGKDAGSAAVYDPFRNRVLARRPWMPVSLVFSSDAAVITTLRGDRIYDASFPHMFKRASWYEKNGSVSCIGEEVFEKKTCIVVEFSTSSPVQNRGIAREKWWLDKASGFPCRVVAFDKDGKEVIRLVLRDLILNAPLSEDHFNL